VSAILAICPAAGCGQLTDGGRCPSCAADLTAADAPRRAAKRKAHGLHTKYWRSLSKQRRDLAEGLCELGLSGCTGLATTAHLDPRLAGDHRAATIDDCLAACRHCHGVIDAARASTSRRPQMLTGGVSSTATRGPDPAPSQTDATSATGSIVR
jgi:hypothetical protein